MHLLLYYVYIKNALTSPYEIKIMYYPYISMHETCSYFQISLQISLSKFVI